MQQRLSDVQSLYDADLASCRAALKEGSRTFWAASLLLPPAVRGPATALYAFCRAADDAVDLGTGCALSAADDLRRRLDLAYAGRPRAHPVDRAFAQVVRRHAIPRTLPAALIEGIGWDAEGRRYHTFSDLTDYAARVAGAVGAMMALLMGARDADAVARACDLGVAMQFSNIARDVGEDAANGRLYLPRGWLIEAGIDPDAFLSDPRATPELRDIVHRLLAEADRLYERAEAGIARLPLSCRPGIAAARLLYAEIGREVERLGPDMLDRRAVVPGRRKLELLPRALGSAGWTPSAAFTAPPLAEVRFLVDAVTQGGLPPVPESAAPSTGLASGRGWMGEGRLTRVIDLFDRLERWEKDGRPGARRGRDVTRRLGRA